MRDPWQGSQRQTPMRAQQHQASSAGSHPRFSRAQGITRRDIAKHLRLPRHRPTGCSTQIVQVCVVEEASLRDVSCGCFQGDITGWLGVARFDSLVARRLW